MDTRARASPSPTPLDPPSRRAAAASSPRVGARASRCRRSTSGAGATSRPTGAATGASGSSSRCSCCQLFAEFIANDKPIIARYKGELLFPVLVDYPESKFGGFLAVTDYKDPVILDEIDDATAG